MWLLLIMHQYDGGANYTIRYNLLQILKKSARRDEIEWNRGSVSALSAGAYTATLYVWWWKAERRRACTHHPHQPGLIFPSWWDVGQINYLYTYDLYSPMHNVLDACISITRASGRGLGPGIRKFFGPVKWHESEIVTLCVLCGCTISREKANFLHHYKILRMQHHHIGANGQQHQCIGALER